MAKINIFALGGLDENGKNSYVIEIDDSIFLINAGSKIPINSTNGVDTLIPNFNYLEKNKKRIKGVFITDAKNESFSALPWLLMKIKKLKIYCSSFTKFLILDRISKYKIDELSFEVISVGSSKIDFGDNVSVSAISLAGSMVGTYGWNFETEDGHILVLLNFVLGSLGVYGTTDLKKIKQNITSPKGLHSLLMVSGNAIGNAVGNAIDKIFITPIIETVFFNGKPDSRIIVGALDEEMASLHEVLNLAIKYDRPLAIYGRTYSKLIELVKKIRINSEYVEMPKFIDYKDIDKVNNAVVLVTSTNERLYKRFLRITEGNDIYLKLRKTDNVIMVAPPINGLEVLYALILDEIARITPLITDVTENEHYKARPARKDIYTIVKHLKPKFFIPLQGLYRYLVVTSQIAATAGMNRSNLIILQNGKIATFIDGKLYSTKKSIKEVGEVIIDGFGMGDISTEVINERETLAREGVIAITGLIDYKTKQLKSELKITTSGIITSETKNEAYEIISSLGYQLFLNNKKINLKDIQDKLKKMVRKKMYKLYEKEPMVVVVFYEI
ncbi:ribonuclease J [Mesomycoplasma neurolyticum]|uniref:Hydrolase n=1 Tax=Mesomycoplasma neurolyticum TaxID=2120 RepID=A0A449A5Y7_9BACT|nr:ribonuclease J [Mesomycoplasma neurolyticum]VEU59644.1 hydrolase [Mesomycoplasma neurolyticum]